MLKVGVFHPGTQHSWQTALAFQDAGQLSWYATSVFYDPKRWPYRAEAFLPRDAGERLRREFRRRYTPALQPDKVRQFGLWEWIETGIRRAGFDDIADLANRRGNQSFGQRVQKLIEREPVDVVWGYNTSALEVFRWAKPRGIRCVLDQTIGHCAAMNRIMAEEQRRNPDFFVQSYDAFSAAAIAQQDEELALADLVVVGSDFCAKTLIEDGCSPEKIRVVPYGFDETLFPGTMPERPIARGKPIDFLFVGLIGPRKGVAPLLQAFTQIPAELARLTLVGRLEIPPATFARFAYRVRHVGSVSRQDVVQYFTGADCFIFPSLFEGGGIVLYEAAASALGIVQSSFCGDGVREGRNGVMLGDVSPTSIQNTVEAVCADPKRLSEWQEASWKMRSERSWGVYHNRIRELVAS